MSHSKGSLLFLGALIAASLSGCAITEARRAARETHASYRRCHPAYVGATDYGPIQIYARQGLTGRVLRARQVQAQGCGAYANYICAEVDTGYGVRWQCVVN